jgi:hypothetical protein
MPQGWSRFASIILAPGKRAGPIASAGWLWPFHHHYEQHSALVPPANPAHAPAINVIADGDLSEEPEKLGLNLHGDPCMTLPGSAVKAACDQFRFSTAIG